MIERVSWSGIKGFERDLRMAPLTLVAAPNEWGKTTLLQVCLLSATGKMPTRFDPRKPANTVADICRVMLPSGRAAGDAFVDLKDGHAIEMHLSRRLDDEGVAKCKLDRKCSTTPFNGKRPKAAEHAAHIARVFPLDPMGWDLGEWLSVSVDRRRTELMGLCELRDAEPAEVEELLRECELEDATIETAMQQFEHNGLSGVVAWLSDQVNETEQAKRAKTAAIEAEQETRRQLAVPAKATEVLRGRKAEIDDRLEEIRSAMQGEEDRLARREEAKKRHEAANTRSSDATSRLHGRRSQLAEALGALEGRRRAQTEPEDEKAAADAVRSREEDKEDIDAIAGKRDAELQAALDQLATAREERASADGRLNTVQGFLNGEDADELCVNCRPMVEQQAKDLDEEVAERDAGIETLTEEVERTRAAKASALRQEGDASRALTAARQALEELKERNRARKREARAIEQEEQRLEEMARSIEELEAQERAAAEALKEAGEAYDATRAGADVVLLEQEAAGLREELSQIESDLDVNARRETIGASVMRLRGQRSGDEETAQKLKAAVKAIGPRGLGATLLREALAPLSLEASRLYADATGGALEFVLERDGQDVAEIDVFKRTEMTGVPIDCVNQGHFIAADLAIAAALLIARGKSRVLLREGLESVDARRELVESAQKLIRNRTLQQVVLVGNIHPNTLPDVETPDAVVLGSEGWSGR